MAAVLYNFINLSLRVTSLCYAAAMTGTRLARSAFGVCLLLWIHASVPCAAGPVAPASARAGGADPANAARSFDPTGAYEIRSIEGWPVRVNRRLLNDHTELADKTLDLLRFQLYQITREVPTEPLARLRTVTLWVELNDPLFPCMCYHPDRGWLTSHGLNPDKAHGVELANARRFLQWEHSQPWMVFHELSHAYHDQFLPNGFRNQDVLGAYRAAKAGALYDAVLRNNGHIERAYALTNPMEYFAECSEAMFGTNDFYPFVRVEFERHDPRGYEVLRRAWGLGDRGSAAPATAPSSAHAD
jgi:hypothetical protein